MKAKASVSSEGASWTEGFSRTEGTSFTESISQSWGKSYTQSFADKVHLLHHLALIKANQLV